MKDFLGNPLADGDKVIITVPNYREFAKGVVMRHTQCYVFVEYKHPTFGMLTVKQTPNQVIKY